MLPGKTFDTLDLGALTPVLGRKLRELTGGSFLEGAVNLLAFGPPGVGKSHAACALGHALVQGGHAVLFRPAYQLVLKDFGGGHAGEGLDLERLTPEGAAEYLWRRFTWRLG